MERKPSYFRPGGTMEPTAPSYIERNADAQLLSALLAGEYVFLLDSRQKGKSSLVARSIVELKKRGVATVRLDLQFLGANVTTEQWYAGILSEIGNALGCSKETVDYWDSHMQTGPLMRWAGALRDVVLPSVSSNIVIFIDEIDFVRALPFSTDEFFAGIRDCYNRRSEQAGFERLTFCLVGVATPGQLIRNPDITPFNIGTKIELTDFTLEETRIYAKVLSKDSRNGELLMKRVHHWVSGHPYLTQLLCSQISESPSISSNQDVDKLVKELFLTPDARHSEPNFAAVEQRILDPDVPGMTPDERKTQVLELYGRLLRGKGVEASEENPVVASLKLAGVGHQVQGSLRVRNRVYQTVFDEGWRRQSLPNAELRRQRGAARLAILRTAAVAGVVVLAISSAAVGILKISEEREKALVTLGQRTKDLSKVSSDRKVALTDLEKRNLELKRISKEREDALSSLEKSNENLSNTSNERKRAVVALKQQSSALLQRNEELSRVSKERAQALSALGSRTNELKARTYGGLMSSVRLAMNEDRYMRVAQLVKEAKDSPLRGWEWGHAAMLVNSFEAEFLLPSDEKFELQTDNSLCVITKDGKYDVTPKGLRLRRKFANPQIYPWARRGDLRIGSDGRGSYVFRNAETDKVIASIPNIRLLLDADGVDRSILVWADSLASRGRFELRSIEGNKPPVIFEGLASGPLAAKFMSDGTILSVAWGGEVIRWDRSGRKLSSQQIPYFVTYSVTNPRLWSSPDGTVFCFYDDQYRLLEVRRTSDLNVVATMSGAPLRASSCSFSVDSSKLIVGGHDGSVRVFKTSTGELLKAFAGHPSRVHAAFYLEGSNRVVSVDDDYHMRIWSFDSKPAVDVYKVLDRSVSYAVLVNGGRTLLSWESNDFTDHRIASRNLQTGLVVSRKGGLSDSEGADSHVFLALDNGRVERLSANGLKVERSVQVFNDAVAVVDVFSKGTRLLVTSRSTSGEPWPREYAILDSRSMSVLSRFSLDWPKHGANYPSHSIDSSGNTILISSIVKNNSPSLPLYGGLAFVVSGSSGKIMRQMKLTEQFHASALTPDGKQFVVAMYEPKTKFSRATVFDVATLKEVFRFPPVKNFGITWFQFDPAGRTLAGRMLDGKVNLWDFAMRRHIGILSPGSEIKNIDFSPDGTRVLTGGANRANILWDSRTGEEVFALRYEPLRKLNQIGDLPSDLPTFSDDGRKIIMACTDGAVRIFNSLPWKDQPKAARK